MKDALIVSALSVLPRNRGAHAMGRFARSPLSSWLTRAFVRVYGVDMREAEHPIEAYPTLEALFTRTLRAGARPVDPTPEALVSPVDGRVAAIGTTVGGKLPLPGGKDLDLPSLLGEPAGELDVAVLYLSPRDYHRVHCAREGAIEAWRYTPGTLWPVFPAAVRKVDGLFSRNERMVLTARTDAGPLHTVLVGAFGVGRIEVAVTDLLSNDGAGPAGGPLDPPQRLGRGDWLGTFHLGSTVVLAAPAGTWAWVRSSGEAVRMGETLAHLRTR